MNHYSDRCPAGRGFHEQILDSSMDAVVAVDMNGRVTFWNAAARRIYGWSRREVIGQHILELVVAESPSGRRDEVLAALSSGRIWSGEYLSRTRNGNVFPVYVTLSPLFAESGAVEGAVGVCRDISDTKRAAKALEESEGKYRALVENMPDIVMRFDRAGRHLFVSKNVGRVVDVPAEEFIGKTHRELGFPDELCRFWERAIDQVFETGRSSEREFTLEHRGREVILDWRLVPECEGEGQVRSVLSIARDITALRRVQHDYQTLFREMRDGFALHEIICDDNARPIDYRFLDINPAFAEMTGLGRRIVGTTIREVLPATESRWIERFGRVALTGRPVSFEDWHGELGKCFAVTAYRPAPKQFACVIADVTERKQAEERLRKSETKYREITENIEEGIYKTERGIFTYVNKAVCDMYGYTESELIGMPSWELAREDVRDEIRREFFRMSRERKPGTMEIPCRRKDGSVVWSEVRINRLIGATGVLGLILDITERKRAEQELRETNRLLEAQTARANTMAARAEMASAAKSEFLANMSHEIRTPMNGVMGMAQVLLGTPLTAEQREYAETVVVSAESLLEIIDDILDFSKIEAGKLQIDTHDFDVRMMLDGFAGMMRPRARARGLEFDCTVSADVPSLLRGDPGRLRQVLVNLTANAIKFTHAGSVTVHTAVQTENATEVVIRFSVRDTGIGIPRDKHDRLFRQFTQLDASMTRTYGGTGLGLVISKQLTEMMGGEIGVHSEEGRGSEFWFTARLVKQSDGNGSPPSSSGTGRAAVPIVTDAVVKRQDGSVATKAGHGRILLAEDNVVNQRVCLGMLGKLGVRVDVVSDGTEAIAALERTAYDLVLMDIQMPRIDGLEATARIRNSTSRVLNHDIPVIALTAHAMRGDREKFLTAGVNDYVAKPMSLDRLSDVLKRWLPGEGPRGPVARKRVPERSATPVGRHGEESGDALFDRAAFLERVSGDEAFARRVIRTFLEDMPRQIDSLKRCLEQGDCVNARRRAHSIKGAAANTGVGALSRSARVIEQRCGERDITAAREYMPRVEEVWRGVRAAMLERETPPGT